jgi:hypothetical protein
MTTISGDKFPTWKTIASAFNSPKVDCFVNVCLPRLKELGVKIRKVRIIGRESFAKHIRIDNVTEPKRPKTTTLFIVIWMKSKTKVHYIEIFPILFKYNGHRVKTAIMKCNPEFNPANGYNGTLCIK